MQAADALAELAAATRQRGTELWLASVRGPALETLARADVLGAVRVARTLDEAAGVPAALQPAP